jgi:hypothetical protein
MIRLELLSGAQTATPACRLKLTRDELLLQTGLVCHLSFLQRRISHIHYQFAASNGGVVR